VKLTKIAGAGCDDDDCPAVYRTDRGTVGVQGIVLSEFTCPDGEIIVEITVDLLLRAARAIS
jgi:hypothetical protein